MKYSNLLVGLHAPSNSSRVMDFSLRIAQQTQAHLTAVFMERVPADIYALDEENLREARAQERDTFVQAAKQAGVSHDWHVARGYDIDATLDLVRCQDLVLVGQFDPGVVGWMDISGLPHYLLLGSSRPVLVLPEKQDLPSAFEQITVAWNGSREAARALFDALPYLREARHIRLITAPPRHHSAHIPQADPEAILRGHGIIAEISVQACAHNDTPALLELISNAETRPDLLVAGAYGHSRIGETLFGGTTFSLLLECPCPLLMVH